MCGVNSFDIDEKSTGKKQSNTFRSSDSLSDAYVEKMVQEHADMILARNAALHEAARLGGELASAQERSASVAGRCITKL